ncbi:hypothetical protein IPL68_07060 [Candidatus Saccharibacteria bacterium]|nr:MAG: hypothetical protein IPL68_07060 [Candidatus Saccharibacteria bacterium]
MSHNLVLHPSTREAVDRYLARPVQSLLVTGASGSGLSTLARDITATLLVTREDKLHEHPYVRIITPENGTIGIAHIRDLQNFVSLQVPSQSSGWASYPYR